MFDVYTTCPTFENERYLLRMTEHSDCVDLLRVYSDEKAVPLFNSDNCNGDDFHYTTIERMKQQIDFWLREYTQGYYVRWSIISKRENAAVGTIELFNRRSEDCFNNCGLLRLDLRSDYESKPQISDILSLILPHTAEMFGCDIIATKAVPIAVERISALKELGYTLSEHKLIGHDGTRYGDYYFKKL